jgi:hypothetical protein
MDEVSRSDVFMGTTLHEGWYMSSGCDDIGSMCQ